MTLAANLGFPRIGAKRELKQALESYWAGTSDLAALQATAKTLRARHWQAQKHAGLSVIPSNDFSLYDQVLDTTALFGAIPPRFAAHEGQSDTDLLFAMARGTPEAPAMEMTKWFDTNYHYIVPEFHRAQSFRRAGHKPLEEYREAKTLGIDTRPVILGPVTWLSLGKSRDAGFDPARSSGSGAAALCRSLE